MKRKKLLKKKLERLKIYRKSLFILQEYNGNNDLNEELQARINKDIEVLETQLLKLEGTKTI